MPKTDFENGDTSFIASPTPCGGGGVFLKISQTNH